MKKIKVLISEEKINNRLDELANQIMDEYKGKDIVFLCILKGSIFFTVELAKRIKITYNLNLWKFQAMKIMRAQVK